MEILIFYHTFCISNGVVDVVLQIKIATTQAELEQAFKIRYQVFGEEFGFLDVDQYPDQKESDEYDGLDITTNFLAIIHNKPAGTIRFTRDSSRGLHTENFADLAALRLQGRKLGEGSRFAVLPEYRGKTKKISLGLLKILHNYAVHQGLNDLCISSAANKVVEVYKAMGYYQIGETKYYKKFNFHIFPMRIELDRILEPFKSIFQEPSDEIEEPYNSSRIAMKI
jgi:N-acyl-L-homoserine lactone synthetase